MARKVDLGFKLLLVGDCEVGKTSLVQRYTRDTFTDTYVATLGIDRGGKRVEIDDKMIGLQIFDTAGPEKMSQLTTTYYKGTHGVLIVCDLTKQGCFDDVDGWVREVNCYVSSDTPIVIVGNKSDLEEERAIDYSTAKEYAEERKLDYIETSAKNSTNINEMFTLITKRMIDNLMSKKTQKPKEAEHKNKSRTCSLL